MGRRVSGIAMPPECWPTQKWTGGSGECGEDPAGHGGSGQAEGLCSTSHSLPLALSPSWTPISCAVLVLSVIETVTLLFEMCVCICLGRTPSSAPMTRGGERESLSLAV